MENEHQGVNWRTKMSIESQLVAMVVTIGSILDQLGTPVTVEVKPHLTETSEDKEPSPSE